MKKLIVLLVISLAIVGCAPKAHEMSRHIGNTSLGMTKQQVISVMGQPYSVSAKGRTEYMSYRLCTEEGNLMNDYHCRNWRDYFVRLVNGRVESYGRTGDFDSTKVPESTQNINLKIN